MSAVLEVADLTVAIPTAASLLHPVRDAGQSSPPYLGEVSTLLDRCGFLKQEHGDVESGGNPGCRRFGQRHTFFHRGAW